MSLRLSRHGAAALCAIALVGCGSSPRPAAHPDFHAMQIREAEVASASARAADESASCEERRHASAECDQSAQLAADAIAPIDDPDLSARSAHLRERCDAAAATVAASCPGA